MHDVCCSNISNNKTSNRMVTIRIKTKKISNNNRIINSSSNRIINSSSNRIINNNSNNSKLVKITSRTNSNRTKTSRQTNANKTLKEC